MVTTPLARAGILKSLKKAKIVKIIRKLFFHTEVEYPKLQIPRKTKNSVFEQISGLPPRDYLSLRNDDAPVGFQSLTTQ